MAKFERELEKLLTAHDTDKAVDDPRLRLLVNTDLTWTGPRTQPADMSQTAEQIADIANDYGLGPDDMERAIELCRHVIVQETRQGATKALEQYGR